jgi:hypothetical protein
MMSLVHVIYPYASKAVGHQLGARLARSVRMEFDAQGRARAATHRNTETKQLGQ